MARSYWLYSSCERSDLFWRRSPLAQVSKVKTPVLIYAGERPVGAFLKAGSFSAGCNTLRFPASSSFILAKVIVFKSPIICVTI